MFLARLGLGQFSAVPLTGMLKPTQTVTIYWITCHTIKEPPFYRCGHPLQEAQSVIEMKLQQPRPPRPRRISSDISIRVNETCWLKFHCEVTNYLKNSMDIQRLYGLRSSFSYGFRDCKVHLIKISNRRHLVIIIRTTTWRLN